jgi:nucleoid-associated protein YgaU
MRRDVRMGFAVGGVLLAVIIVAFLAIHRNHKQAVAFDKGTGDGSPDASSVDVNGSAPDATKAGAPNPSAALDSTSAKMADKPGDAKSPAAAEGEKADSDRWDALFASTGPNPAKNQLSQAGGSSNGSSAKSPGRKSEATSPKVAAQPGESIAPNLPVPNSDPAPVAEARQPNLTAGESVRTHTIQPNETLSGISKLVYGESRHYKVIEAANPGIDSTRLKPGTVLKIPALEKAKPTEKAAAPARSAADGKTYVVQKDDNLYKITRKLYGNGEKQEQLYEMNKQTIGADSTKLKPGMVLKLPAAPAAQ